VQLVSLIEILKNFEGETLVFLERQLVFSNLKEKNMEISDINKTGNVLKSKNLQYEKILDNEKFIILVIKKSSLIINQCFRERINLLFGTSIEEKQQLDLKIEKITADNNKNIPQDLSICQCLSGLSELVIILNKQGGIIECNKNLLKFFGVTVNQNINNLSHLFHVLRENQVLPEHMQDLSYESLVNNIMKEKEVILLTLSDKYYSFQAKLRDFNHYILFIREVTQQLNARLDLQNNYQLINYLLQWMKVPMVVFNKSKLIEFTNITAQEMFGPEMLDHSVSIKTFVDLLQKHFAFERVMNEENNSVDKAKLYFKHGEEKYEISNRVIGDFTCLLMEKVKGNSLLKDLMFSKQKNIENTINLLQSIDRGKEKSPLNTRENVINKISNNMKKEVSKVNDYLQLFHCNDTSHKESISCEESFLIPQLVDSLIGSWINRKNIYIENQITESFAISAHQKEIQKILEWIVDDLDFLCEKILLEFKTLKEHVCIQIKLLKQHPSLEEYKKNLLESVKEVYNKIIQKNHGVFHIISDQRETTIQIILVQEAAQNNNMNNSN
jgi:PAS domain-containing protein